MRGSGTASAPPYLCTSVFPAVFAHARHTGACGRHRTVCISISNGYAQKEDIQAHGRMHGAHTDPPQTHVKCDGRGKAVGTGRGPVAAKQPESEPGVEPRSVNKFSGGQMTRSSA